MTAVVLRPGRDDDAEGFIALIGACWAEYPGNVLDVDGEVPELRALASYFAGQGGGLWVHETAGRLTGMIGTRPLADGAWELCKVYVDGRLRGGGVALALLQAAEDFARARGATVMRLWTDARFDRAHRFYEKHGYLRDGPIRALNDLSNSMEFEYARPLAGIVVRSLDAAAASAARFDRATARAVALGTAKLLVAWNQGVLAGTAEVALEAPHRATIRALTAEPPALGRALLDAAVAAAARPLVLFQPEAGSPAEALARDAGWREAGRIPGYARDANGAPRDAVILYHA